MLFSRFLAAAALAAGAVQLGVQPVFAVVVRDKLAVWTQLEENSWQADKDAVWRRYKELTEGKKATLDGKGDEEVGTHRGEESYRPRMAREMRR